MTDFKIIQFPTERITRMIPDPLTEDKEREKARRAERKYADNSIEDMMFDIRSDLDNIGIEYDPEINGKDYILLHEAVRSIIYKHFGFDHWLQELAQERCELIDPNKEKDS